MIVFNVCPERKFRTSTNHILLVWLLIGLSISAHGNAEVLSPRVHPQGWVADFDYNNDLVDYLKANYLIARQQQRVPYVYFYFDDNKHCRQLRRLLKRDDVREAFNNTHIVMLNYNALREKFNSKRFSLEASSLFPSLVKISRIGGLEGPVFYPDHYLFHPTLVDDPEYRRYRTYRKWSGAVPKRIFARRIKDYLRQDAERYVTQKERG